MNTIYKLFSMFNAHSFLNCNRYLAAKSNTIHITRYLKELSLPQNIMLSALAGKTSYSDCCKNTPECESEKKEKGLGDFNIFAMHCDWIRQLKEGEADPTHGRKYYHHQMYHKHTYYDVISALAECRLPVPSNKKPSSSKSKKSS